MHGGTKALHDLLNCHCPAAWPTAGAPRDAALTRNMKEFTGVQDSIAAFYKFERDLAGGKVPSDTRFAITPAPVRTARNTPPALAS